MEFSPDGRQLITGHIDGNLRLWDTMSGSPGPVLRGHTDMVVQVRFSPDGQLIASGGTDSTVRLWDSSLCTLISLYSTSRPVFDVSFSSDGLTLALADSCNKVRLWDGSSNGSSVGQPGHSYSVESVAYLPTGQSVLSGGLDKTVRKWDTLTGALESTHVLTGLSSEVLFVQKLSPDTQQSACCFDETIHLQDLQTGVVELFLEGHTDDIKKVAHSPCGRWIASTSKDGSVRLWDLHNGGQGHVLFETNAEFNAASAFTSTGLRLAVGFIDGTVNIYDTQSKELLTTTTIEDQRVRALAYSPNNLELAIGCQGGVVVFWDRQSDEPGHVLHFGTDAVCCITYSPWKDWLAFGGDDMRVHLCRRCQSESSDMEALWCVVFVVEGVLDWVWDIA
ncbi:WD40 repeat-like protein, partial [Linnemannia elongata AG-77]